MIMDDEENTTIHLILTDQQISEHEDGNHHRQDEKKTITILAAVYVLLVVGLFTLPRLASQGMFGLASAGAAGATAILVGATMTVTSLVGFSLTMWWWNKLSLSSPCWVRAMGILPIIITTIMLIVVAKLLKNPPI